MKNKPLLHNQLVRLWANPSTKKFRSFYEKTHGLFDDKDDAQNLIKFGAYLIAKGNKKSLDIKPFDRTKGLENWVNNIEGDILFHVGIEYFIKGLFLYKGYAINKPKRGQSLTEPYLLKGNKGKLDATETHTLAYFIRHIDVICRFNVFDISQERKNIAYKDLRSNGIVSFEYKHPNHEAILNYIAFSRNKYLHTQKKIPEFRGITDEIMELLDYMANEVCKKGLRDLANLKVIYV